MLCRRIAFVLALLLACKEPAKEETTDEGPGPTAAAKGEPESACDPTKVEALYTALQSAEPAARPALVQAQLPGACELPPAIASAFAPASAESAKHARDALTSICKDALEVYEAMVRAAADQRMALVWDACDLARFDLVEKAAWLSGEPSSAIPFFAFSWLRDENVSDAHAKAIASAMLLGDRRRLALADQVLPKVSHALAPVPRLPAVFITASEIRFDDRTIATIALRSIDPSAKQGHLVGPLFDVLAEDADKRRHIAQATGDAWDPTLVLVADARTSMEVIVDVLYTAGRAELLRYAFVAETGPFAYGVIPVDLQQYRPSGGMYAMKPVGVPERGMGPALEVEVGQSDLAALARKAEQHAREHAGATQAVVNVPLEDDYDAFVQTLATLRGKDCDANKACLLPDIALSFGVPAFDPDTMAKNAGILGILAEGGGSGSDVELGEAVAKARAGEASVAGDLDSNVIRRIVRAHLGEVRSCYEDALAKDPSLAGKVVVKFVIAASGEVASAKADEDTLSVDDVSKCIIEAVERWKFPKPTKPGNVTVTYPFTFSPS